MKQSKATEQAEQRTDACNNARSRMAALDAGGRQMRFNERGERYFLDDRMVANERASAQREATQSCG